MSNRFHITWVSAGQNYIAINPASGDWLLLDPVSKQIVNELESGASITDIINAHPSVAREDIANLLQQLKERDFTSTKDVLGFTCRDCHDGHYPILAVLNLTEQCNLKCTYCYVRAGENQVELMTPETAYKIIDGFLEMKPEGRFNITMHGGEPLINYPLVQKIVEYAKPHRDKIDLSIQTNGTLLTQERVEFLKENDVSIGVSLDGPKKYHDQTRVLQNGKGSFDQVMRGIKLLQDNQYTVSTISVLTAHDADHMDELLDFFIENKILDLSFLPMQKIGRGLEDDDSALSGEQIFNAFKVLIDRIIDYNSSPGHTKKLFERKASQLARNIFYKIKDFMCMRSPCGAGRDILGFGIHGDFYMCDDFINDEDFKVGNVYDGSIKEQMLHSDLLKEKIKRSMQDMPRCKDCIWRQFCGGICYSSDHYSGSKGVLETEMCIFYQKIIPYLIQKYAENPDLPKLLDYELDDAGKTLYIAINDTDNYIDPESLLALLKVHSVGNLSNVYLHWNSSHDKEELQSMLKTIRSSGACIYLVIHAENPLFEELGNITKQESVNVIRILFNEDLGKLEQAKQLAQESKAVIELFLPFSLIQQNKPSLWQFKGKVNIICDALSKDDASDLNFLLDELRKEESDAKINVIGAATDLFDLDNLIFNYQAEKRPTLYIDEDHLIGHMLDEIPICFN